MVQSKSYQLLLQHLVLLLLHLLLKLLLPDRDLGFLGLEQSQNLTDSSGLTARMIKRHTSLYVEADSEKEGFIRDI